MAIGEHLVVLLQLFCHVSLSSVSVSIGTKPIIFGQSAKLVCKINDQLFNGKAARFWTKGENDFVIVKDGVSTDKMKYEEIMVDSVTYILTIHSFGENDVNTKYRCRFGMKTLQSFVSGKVLLKLNEQDFEYHPTRRDINLYIGRVYGYLEADLLIRKVFPKPFCTIFYHNTNLTKHVKYDIWNGSMFYSAQINMHEVPVDNSDAIIRLKCRIGSTDVNIGSRRFPDASGGEIEIKENNTQSSTIAVVIGCIICSCPIILTVIIVIYYRSRHAISTWCKNCKRISMTDDSSMPVINIDDVENSRENQNKTQQNNHEP